MNKHPIGVIDSGSGGLSVWRELRRLLPLESTIYVGDHRHLPYSEKTTAFIRGRVRKIMDFLEAKNVKMIVVACNTATVAGIDVYRGYFPDIPVIGVVPVIKTASELTKTGHIAVFSTAYTAKSQYQKDLIRQYASGITVENIGSADLVSYIEDGRFRSFDVKRKLRVFLSHVTESDADVLALGCTHYPFITEQIRDVVGSKIDLLDSGGAVARHAKRVLSKNKTLSLNGKPRYDFYTTGEQSKVSFVASSLLNEAVRFSTVNIGT
jgi:glutamate racemase